jgi:hypothetical protein
MSPHEILYSCTIDPYGLVTLLVVKLGSLKKVLKESGLIKIATDTRNNASHVDKTHKASNPLQSEFHPHQPSHESSHLRAHYADCAEVIEPATVTVGCNGIMVVGIESVEDCQTVPIVLKFREPATVTIWSVSKLRQNKSYQQHGVDQTPCC